MFSSNIYSYVDVLNKAANASWLREQTISNNISMQIHLGIKEKMWILKVSYEKNLGI